jgi:outer membrane protein
VIEALRQRGLLRVRADAADRRRAPVEHRETGRGGLIARALLAALFAAAASIQGVGPARAASSLDPQAAPAPASAPTRVITLEEALRNAREHQPLLRQTHAATAAAAARAREAQAGLLPQVTAQAAYLRTTANFFARPGSVPAAAGGGSGGSLRSFNFFSDSVTANQLLYDFGQTSGRASAFEALAVATADSGRATELQVLLSVRTAYFDAYASRALVAVARETLTNLRLHLAQIEGFVQVGTRPDIDLAQARSDAANAEVQLITAENTYEISKATLNQTMGIAGALDYEVAAEKMPAVGGEAQLVEPLLEEALLARPEIASIREQVRAQQLTLRSIQGAYGPSLGANAGLTQGGVALDQYRWNLSAGLTLTWQLYQGGLVSAQVREVEANVAQLVAQYDFLREQLRVEVQQTRLAVRGARASIGAVQEALANARLRLQLAEARYQTGVGNAIELGDAQVAVTAAAVQAVQAEQRLSTARAQLLKALGRF